MPQDENEKRFLQRVRRLRQRSKISFTKPEIDKAINDLRRGNDDLERLWRQIDALQKAKKMEEVKVTKPMGDVSVVQKASRNLHEVLSNPLSCRAEHSVALSLDIINTQDVSENPGKTIIFGLVWKCQSQTPSANEALSLAIETQLEEATAHVRESANLVHEPLKDPLITSLREVNIHSPVSGQSNLLIPEAISARDTPLIRDICMEMRDHRKQQKQPQLISDSNKRCIGLLQDSPDYKHLLFCGPEDESSHMTISLQDALRKARTLLCGIPPIDRMHLARTLSIAVLQLHPTPWLENTWQSEDILFFGIEDLDREPLAAPHLATRFIGPKKSNSGRAEISNQPALVPNATLYSFGIILIEIAFERPLADMLEPSDSSPGDPISVSLHRAVIRLADVIGKKIHVGYERVVKRCLWCNFETKSMNTRLDDRDLQEAFYKFVVCELDRCFQAIAMF